jgi:hypothetical protein
MEVSTEGRSCILYGWESGRFDHGLEHQIDYFAIKIAGQVAEEIVFETAKGIVQDFLEHISVRLLTALLPGDRQRLLDMQTPFSEYEPDDFLGLPCFKLWAAAHQRATALISPRVLRLQELAALAMRDGEVDAAQMRRFL